MAHNTGPSLQNTLRDELPSSVALGMWIKYLCSAPMVTSVAYVQMVQPLEPRCEQRSLDRSRRHYYISLTQKTGKPVVRNFQVVIWEVCVAAPFKTFAPFLLSAWMLAFFGDLNLHALFSSLSTLLVTDASVFVNDHILLVGNSSFWYLNSSFWYLISCICRTGYGIKNRYNGTIRRLRSLNQSDEPLDVEKVTLKDFLLVNHCAYGRSRLVEPPRNQVC